MDLNIGGKLTVLALHKLCQCMTLTQFDTGTEIGEACTMDVDCKSNSWKFDFVWMAIYAYKTITCSFIAGVMYECAT